MSGHSRATQGRSAQNKSDPGRVSSSKENIPPKQDHEIAAVQDDQQNGRPTDLAPADIAWKARSQQLLLSSSWSGSADETPIPRVMDRGNRPEPIRLPQERGSRSGAVERTTAIQHKPEARNNIHTTDLLEEINREGPGPRSEQLRETLNRCGVELTGEPGNFKAWARPLPHHPVKSQMGWLQILRSAPAGAQSERRMGVWTESERKLELRLQRELISVVERGMLLDRILLTPRDPEEVCAWLQNQQIPQKAPSPTTSNIPTPSQSMIPLVPCHTPLPLQELLHLRWGKLIPWYELRREIEMITPQLGVTSEDLHGCHPPEWAIEGKMLLDRGHARSRVRILVISIRRSQQEETIATHILTAEGDQRSGWTARRLTPRANALLRSVLAEHRQEGSLSAELVNNTGIPLIIGGIERAWELDATSGEINRAVTILQEVSGKKVNPRKVEEAWNMAEPILIALSQGHGPSGAGSRLQEHACTLLREINNAREESANHDPRHADRIANLAGKMQQQHALDRWEASGYLGEGPA